MQPTRTSMSQRWTKWITPLLTALFVCVSTVTAAGAVPLEDLLMRGIQVLQFSNISPGQEVRLGTQMHQNLLQKGVRLYGDPTLNRNVTQVGQRLVAQSRRGIPYRFFVVQDKGINAFATMGGYVYITTGLLAAADNEAQLASVMGHEIGHIEKRHLITQMQNAMITRGLVETVLGVDQNQLADIGIELLVNRPQSREDEYQADLIGLRLLRDADYAVAAMPAFMQKLVRQGGSGPTLLSTHPAVPARRAALEVAIQKGPNNGCSGPAPAASCGLEAVAYQAGIKQYLRR
jgi:beta-barrel assembly-enhancing protease